MIACETIVDASLMPGNNSMYLNELLLTRVSRHLDLIKSMPCMTGFPERYQYHDHGHARGRGRGICCYSETEVALKKRYFFRNKTCLLSKIQNASKLKSNLCQLHIMSQTGDYVFIIVRPIGLPEGQSRRSSSTPRMMMMNSNHFR